MYCTNIATSFGNPFARKQPNREKEVEHADSEHHEILQVALHLLELGRAEQADQLLTAAAFEEPLNSDLWLAAGICRLRRGAVRSAETAFEMSAWLDDDPYARSLFALCEQLPSF